MNFKISHDPAKRPYVVAMAIAFFGQQPFLIILDGHFLARHVFASTLIWLLLYYGVRKGRFVVPGGRMDWFLAIIGTTLFIVIGVALACWRIARAGGIPFN